MKSSRLMKVIMLFSFTFSLSVFSKDSKTILMQLKKEKIQLNKIVSQIRADGLLSDNYLFYRTKHDIDSLKYILKKAGIRKSNNIFHTNSIDLDDNFQLLDFNLHDWTEEAYRITARIKCKKKIYTDFVKLTYQFYKDNVLVGSDYTFIDFITYGFSGMSPYQITFLTDYVDKFDFDDILFSISYNEEDGSGDIYWDQLMKLTNVTIYNEYGLNHWVGTVENRSNYSFTYPKILAAIYKNNRMIEFDFTFLDIQNAPSDSVIIFSVTKYPSDSEQVSLKNCSFFDADISNWTIGDKNDPVAYKIPYGTILSANEIKKFDKNTLNFQIDDEGEIIFLKDEMGYSVDKWIDDTTATLFDIIISSVTTSPTSSEQVTLKNVDNVEADISGWTIGDKNDPIAYNIPNGTILLPGEEKMFSHTQLNFGINDKNEIIYLINQDSVLIDIWYGPSKLLNKIQDRFLPHTNATFDSYITLPDEYDNIKYYLNYSLYSLEGSGNIPPNIPVFTDTAYSSLERTSLSVSMFLLDHEKSYLSAMINWGDNSESAWSNPSLSNFDISFNHSYSEPGEYFITAKAKDDSSAESEWGDSIQVIIAKVDSLIIIEKQLKNGTFKKSYDDTLEAAGGIEPYKWQIINGSLPNGVVLNSTTGRIFGYPLASGMFDFVVEVIDNGFPVETASDTFSLEIFNNPPNIISEDSLIIFEHQPMTYVIKANDPDSNILAFEFENYPSWTRIINDSSLYGIPPEGALDTSFLAIASDGELNDSMLVKITVIPVNDPPQIVNIENFSFRNDENYKINLDTCVIDPDDDIETLIWNIVSSDSHLIVNMNGHNVQFSAPNWSGMTDVMFTVKDSLGAADSLIVDVTVTSPSNISWKDKANPKSYFLGKIYPNPFNSMLSIPFGLPEHANISITIFNIIGEKVAQLVSGEMSSGYYKIAWKANDIPSGIYIVKMVTEKYAKSQKCLLIK